MSALLDKRSGEDLPSGMSLQSDKASHHHKTQLSKPNVVSGINSQIGVEVKAVRSGSHATLGRGDFAAGVSGITGICQSDSTVALAGTSCGAGVGDWERNSVRLTFAQAAHESPSIRAKCAAFWAQVNNQWQVKEMCANGHGTTKEDRQAAIAEAEVAFRDFMGKEWESNQHGEGTHYTDAQKGAEAELSLGQDAAMGMDCRGKVALSGVSQDIKAFDESSGRVGPWQQRLRVLQALGLDRLAAAAEWRDSPIRPPKNWPRSALIRPQPSGAAGEDWDPRIVPAARPPTPSQLATLKEDVLNLPRPLFPTEPGGAAPAIISTEVYRIMPSLLLPLPEEPGPPPAPVLPCPTHWCDSAPCRECMPCDPRYAQALHPQYADASSAAVADSAAHAHDRAAMASRKANVGAHEDDEYYGKTDGHHAKRHHRSTKKHHKHKGHRGTPSCHPGCRCCLCLTKAPPPTPTLTYRRETASGDRTTAKAATADAPGVAQGDNGTLQSKEHFTMDGQASDGTQRAGTGALNAAEGEVGTAGDKGGGSGDLNAGDSTGGSGGGSSGGRGGGSPGGTIGGSDGSVGGSTGGRTIQTLKTRIANGDKNAVSTDMVDGTQKENLAEGIDEVASRDSNRRARLDSAGEVVGLERLTGGPLKEEDPFRSVLLDVLKPGHVRPPLPPPQGQLLKPHVTSTDDDDDDDEEVWHRQGFVIPDIYAADDEKDTGTSLCGLWLPAAGQEQQPPRRPPPSEYVMPGADLSGVVAPAIPPTVAPPGEHSHYVGMRSQLWAPSATATTQPSVRPTSRSSAAVTGATSTGNSVVRLSSTSHSGPGHFAAAPPPPATTNVSNSAHTRAAPPGTHQTKEQSRTRQSRQGVEPMGRQSRSTMLVMAMSLHPPDERPPPPPPTGLPLPSTL